MPGYILMHAEASDHEEYEHFKDAAARAVDMHGWRYLVRGGVSTRLEGEFGSRRRASRHWCISAAVDPDVEASSRAH